MKKWMFFLCLLCLFLFSVAFVSGVWAAEKDEVLEWIADLKNEDLDVRLAAA